MDTTLTVLSILGGLIVVLSAIAGIVAFFGVQRKTSTMTLLQQNNEAQEMRISILEGQAVECDHANSLLKTKSDSQATEIASLTRLVTKEDSVEKLGVVLTKHLDRQHNQVMRAVNGLKPGG